MKNKKGFTLIELLIIIAIIGILLSLTLITFHKANACGGWFESACGSAPTEIQNAATTAATLRLAVPIPQLETSQERINVAKRATIFSKADKLSYIYLVSYGKIMAFYTVKGKVSSLRSYMVPTQKAIYGDGTPCSFGSSSCLIVDAPDIDGTYGENVEGIFFFTTEGAYVEWKGDYMMSDQPLKLATQPELIREIK